MRKLAIIALSFAACLWAADFWQSKPFTEWNDKEMRKMLENSPWARPVSISIGEPRPMAGSGGGGRRRGGGGSTDPMGETGGVGPAGGAASSDIGGAGGRGNRGGAGEDSSDMPRSESMNVIVRWQTALPVRQAMIKLKYGSEATTSPEAKKALESDDRIYAIAVIGVPPMVVRGTDDMKKALMAQTVLSAKGKDELKAADVQFGKANNKIEAYFIFQRKVEFTADDKEIEFSTKFQSVSIRQRFRVKDMMYDGKLAL